MPSYPNCGCCGGQPGQQVCVYITGTYLGATANENVTCSGTTADSWTINSRTPAPESIIDVFRNNVLAGSTAGSFDAASAYIAIVAPGACS
jgi:hypothetical protein